MKFLTVENGGLGVLTNGMVVDCAVAARALGTVSPDGSLLELIRGGGGAARAAWELALDALAQGVAVRPLMEVRPLAPLPSPVRNIFCLGKNYLDHARELRGKVDKGSEVPEHPIFFTKASTSVIGPQDPIPGHRHLTDELDYEAELALIIGKGGRDIPFDRAMEHVFGYTALNDVTARNLQRDHLQWFKGKSLDGFCPLGPVVVHCTAMPGPGDVAVRSWVNGELRQSSTLDQLIFDIPTIVATLSAGLTLLPGDIIATGTPGGVGMGFDPPRFLRPGDEVVVEVGDAGRLVNTVRE